MSRNDFYFSMMALSIVLVGNSVIPLSAEAAKPMSYSQMLSQQLVMATLNDVSAKPDQQFATWDIAAVPIPVSVTSAEGATVADAIQETSHDSGHDSNLKQAVLDSLTPKQRKAYEKAVERANERALKEAAKQRREAAKLEQKAVKQAAAHQDDADLKQIKTSSAKPPTKPVAKTVAVHAKASELQKQPERMISGEMKAAVQMAPEAKHADAKHASDDVWESKSHGLNPLEKLAMALQSLRDDNPQPIQYAPYQSLEIAQAILPVKQADVQSAKPKPVQTVKVDQQALDKRTKEAMKEAAEIQKLIASRAEKERKRHENQEKYRTSWNKFFHNKAKNKQFIPPNLSEPQSAVAPAQPAPKPAAKQDNTPMTVSAPSLRLDEQTAKAPDRIEPDALQKTAPSAEKLPWAAAQSDDEQEKAYNMMTTASTDGLEEPDGPEAKAVYNVDSSKTTTPPNLESLQGDVKVLKSGISSSLSELEVTVNKAVILNLSKPAARVSISDPSIVSAVIISPTQVQLIGNQVGVANLLIWGDTGSPEHTVVDIHVHRDVSVLVKQLHFVDPGIKIVPLAAEDTVILTGQAASREAAALAVELAKAFFKGAGAGGGGGMGGPGGRSGGGGGPASESPGSAIPGGSTSIINLINIKGEPSTKVELARRKLRDIDPNIKLDIVPGADGAEKAILSGRVKASSMISKAINTASVFYGQPGIKVITGPGGNATRSNQAGDNNFQTETAFNSNIDVNVLQGTVMTDTSGNVVSMLEVAQKPQIKCSIQFVEVNKNGLDALGHGFYGANHLFGAASVSGLQSPADGKTIATVDTDDSGAAFLGSRTTRGTLANAMSTANGYSNTFQSGITQILSIDQRFTAAISALEERRKARTLAEPTLTMLSGEKSSFLAGGEVAMPAFSANGQMSITYREFGIRLNLIATYLDNGKIHMTVAPEISSIDRVNNGVPTSNGVIPGFKVRRMQSTLELDNGQAFVLAGLYNQEEIDSVSRFPWAGSIPIIGSLLRNTWKTKSNTEMLVIIKPEVVMLDGDTNQPVTPVSTSAPVTPVINNTSLKAGQ